MANWTLFSQPVIVYIYWEHFNIFIQTHNISEDIENEEVRKDVVNTIRLDLYNMVVLAHENQTILKAVATGSVPHEMRAVWKRLEQEAVKPEIIDHTLYGGHKREVSDMYVGFFTSGFSKEAVGQQPPKYFIQFFFSLFHPAPSLPRRRKTRCASASLTRC